MIQHLYSQTHGCILHLRTQYKKLSQSKCMNVGTPQHSLFVSHSWLSNETPANPPNGEFAGVIVRRWSCRIGWWRD